MIGIGIGLGWGRRAGGIPFDAMVTDEGVVLVTDTGEIMISGN